MVFPPHHSSVSSENIRFCKSFSLSFLPEPGNIHWGSSPHCALVIAQSWISPSLTASAGSHSRKMLSAEIPALFYLITSGCYTGRHNPLLHTFTSNNVIHCRYLSARNGVLPPLSKNTKTLRIKAKIKSGVCVSYEIVSFSGFFKPVIILSDEGAFSECWNPLFSLFIADFCNLTDFL